VTTDRLRELYALSDIFVLPSGAEGFGIVYLEAMAFAKPVIAADAGGAPFVVRPGASGILVTYGDAAGLARSIETLIQDPDAARALGSRGRAFLERNFSFEQMVRRTRSLLLAWGAVLALVAMPLLKAQTPPSIKRRRRGEQAPHRPAYPRRDLRHQAQLQALDVLLNRSGGKDLVDGQS
jgi:hypothetical protein